MISLNEIRSLLKGGKSNTLEFSNKFDKNATGKVLCSFMNTKGGRLILGVEDDGSISGVKVPNYAVEDLRFSLIKGIIPNSPIDFTSVDLKDEKKVIVIKVQEGSKQPYIFDGSIYYRNGEKTRKATSNEVSQLIHQRQEDELHWERQINVNVDWEDLDENLMVKTFSEARKNKKSSYMGDDLGTFLVNYGLMSNMSFTNACTLLFAKNAQQFIPQARIRITEYSSSKTDDNYLNDEYIEGNLFTIVDKLQKHVDQLGTRSLFVENEWQRKDFSFPPFALREGILNAVVHRDYSKHNSHMTISIFPEEIIIANSGSLPEELGGKASLKKIHRSFPHNPDIAHMFFLRGYIEKLGRGTNKIVEECKLAGLKSPSWKDTGSEVILTFNGPKASKSSSYDALALSFDALNKAQNDALSDALSDALNRPASDKILERYIDALKLLWQEEALSLSDLMGSLSVSRATMQRDVLYLNSINLIDFKGSDKYREYLLNDALRTKIDALK